MIRAADASDSDAIWSLVGEVVENGTEFAWRPGTGREQVMASWLGPDLHTYVAELSGAIVAAYVLKANQPGRGSHVANGSYVVAADRRGEGLGRTLGLDSIERARSLGFRAMQFNLVAASNEGAACLWKSLGFESVGTLPEAFEVSGGAYDNALVMFREL